MMTSTNNTAKVLLLLNNETNLGAKQIAQELGSTRNAIGVILSMAKRQGLVHNTDYGRWSLTEQGKEFVQKINTSLTEENTLGVPKAFASKIVEGITPKKVLSRKPVIFVNNSPHKVYEEMHFLIAKYGFSEFDEAYNVYKKIKELATT